MRNVDKTNLFLSERVDITQSRKGSGDVLLCLYLPEKLVWKC